jgi:hypothetical protein
MRCHDDMPECFVLGSCAPRTIRHLDDTSLGRYAAWTIRRLDNTSLGRYVPGTIRPLDDKFLGSFISVSYVPSLDYFYGLRMYTVGPCCDSTFGISCAVPSLRTFSVAFSM